MKSTGNWTELKRILSDGSLPASNILIGLDFDGTLAPLVRRPGAAVVPSRTKQLLRCLAAKKGVQVAVISGRGLRDVRARTGIKGIQYAGNHGLEVRGAGRSWVHPTARAVKTQIRRAARSVQTGLLGEKGYFFEDKGLSLSLHFRGVKAGDAPRAALKIAETAVLVSPRSLMLASGKKVWEIRPRVEWNKGDALLKIASSFRGGKRAIIFVGDDKTDEEGFKTLGRRAITVRVGRMTGTHAQYCLKDQRQVPKLLELLCRVIA